MPQAVASPRTPCNPASVRAELARTQVELLELRQSVARQDALIAELLAERVALRRDVAEWERIAASRAERIVALETSRAC